MRTRWLAGGIALVLVLFAVIVAPVPVALAAPTITVSPQVGPPGTVFTIRGSGFRQNATLHGQRFDPDGQGVDFGPGTGIMTNAQGAFITTTTAPTFGVKAGTYAVRYSYLEADSPVVATANFTVTLPDERCFAETGYCMRGRFLAYWYRHGDLQFVGYPISDEFVEILEDGNSYLVQYFERIRMEYHPENTDPKYQIQLGQFGRRIHPADPPVAPVGVSEGSYYPQTGHNIRGRFRAFFVGVVAESSVGFEYFGYPISEEFYERLEDGNVYLVQYFERARLEWHPETGRGGQILLGQFGRRMLSSR